MQHVLGLGAAGPGRTPQELAALAALAEAAGWDAVLLEDYLVYPGPVQQPTFDVWVCLAAMATATTRVRLGTDVTPLGRQRPWEVAARATSVDHLSSGRMVLGVGAGDVQEASFRTAGDTNDRHVAAGRTDEGIDLIRRLWTGERVDFEGRYFRLEGMKLLPTPVQLPRIPIWVGGNWDVPGVRRRILEGDGCVVYKGTPGTGSYVRLPPEDISAIASLVRAERGSLDGYDICVGGDEPHKTDPSYVRAVRDAGATWWCEWLPVGSVEETRRLVRAGPSRVD